MENETKVELPDRKISYFNVIQLKTASIGCNKEVTSALWCHLKREHFFLCLWYSGILEIWKIIKKY